MNRVKHIVWILAALLAGLSAGSCVQPLSGYDDAQLMVSLYIPDVLPTKAEAGSVNPVGEEHKITTLQIWVFLPDGSPVSYKAFSVDSEEPPFDPDETGLTHATVTRFGLPLSPEMFRTLSAAGATADVYAVANADAGWGLTETTPRADLDAVVLSGNLFGADPLTMSVPAAGLPMSGVLKGQVVTGSYPVLNISTLTLTRAVSKIRFVFVQQGTVRPGSDAVQPLNSHCSIKSIVFDGTTGGASSQIAASEYLFTQETYGETDHLFSISGYVPFAATIARASGPLIAHDDIACVEDPESLRFRSAGHEVETGQAYETRLDAAIGTYPSQVGPIYIRETDQLISGTIVYNTSGVEGEDKTAHFCMEADDVLTRNHSWVVYAYFAEETRELQLTVKVLPWIYDDLGGPIDFTKGSVNVVRRFSVTETDPQTFHKIQTTDGFFDVTFWHTIDGQENILKGDIIIATPVGAKLHAFPVPGVVDINQYTPVPNAFIVRAVTPVSASEPAAAYIYPTRDPVTGTVEACRIEFTIQCNPDYLQSAPSILEGQCIDLHFSVEIGNELRWIDLGSESIDYYRFILNENWRPSTNGDDDQ